MGHRGASTQKARVSWDFESHLDTWAEARLVPGGQGPAVARRHDDERHGGGGGGGGRRG